MFVRLVSAIGALAATAATVAFATPSAARVTTHSEIVSLAGHDFAYPRADVQLALRGAAGSQVALTAL